MSRVIGIHGFQYDDNIEAEATEVYSQWAHAFGADIVPFRYFSRPTFRQAWRRGYLFHYSYAWDLAVKAGIRLSSLLAEQPSSIICHSLGSLVALSALKAKPHTFTRRVIILGGSAYVDEAYAIAQANPQTTFFNVCSPHDRVLATWATIFGPRPFTPIIGRTTEMIQLPNWHNIVWPVNDHHSYTRAMPKLRDVCQLRLRPNETFL